MIGKYKKMLTLEQIQSLIESRPHRKELDRAIVHQNRLKFHTETEILLNELSPYRDIFLSWICAEKPELLPKDKVERFKQLMTCPIPTIQLTQAINIALSRVFEGQDAFFRYDFKDDAKLDDWQEFCDEEFWKEEGMQAMINAIDSVWVVDLPQEQEGDKPEPRNMLIDISNVIDISCKRNGECQYVIFSIGEKLFVYDDESICVFVYQKFAHTRLVFLLPRVLVLLNLGPRVDAHDVAHHFLVQVMRVQNGFHDLPKRHLKHS